MAVTWNGISAIYAALLALWWIVLAIRVVRLRWARRVSLGDGDDPALRGAVRAHGNASESIPLLILMLMLVEFSGLPGWLVHLIGIAAVTGRVLHGLHFMRKRRGRGLRVGGMLLTLAALGGAALVLLGNALAGLA